MEFEVNVETNFSKVFGEIQKKLEAYRAERRGPTVLIVQSVVGKLITMCFFFFRKR